MPMSKSAKWEEKCAAHNKDIMDNMTPPQSDLIDQATSESWRTIRDGYARPRNWRKITGEHNLKSTKKYRIF